MFLFDKQELNIQKVLHVSQLKYVCPKIIINVLFAILDMSFGATMV